MTQKQRAVSPGPNTMCMYRTPTGLKCAAGVLIDDAHYKDDFEGMGVNQLEREFSAYLDQSIFNAENLPFIKELQIIHDETPPHEWGGRLMKLACDNGLDP
jgi:hypothetical protein